MRPNIPLPPLVHKLQLQNRLVPVLRRPRIIWIRRDMSRDRQFACRRRSAQVDVAVR